MEAALASSLIGLTRLALGMKVGTSDAGAGNRCTVEGLRVEPQPDGRLEIGMRKFEASALRVVSGATVLELERLTVRECVVRAPLGVGSLQPFHFEAQDIEIAGLRMSGPLPMPQAAATDADNWTLEPFGTAGGEVRARITDAQWLFDADVTVPVEGGQVDFNHASVAHVGPDSRMGVSRLGIYVDAPTGRNYLYQFASAPLAGVEFEHRGTLLGPWVSERGKLHLRAFVESVLRQGMAAREGEGLTAQARALLARTTLAGELRLGDGMLVLPGLQLQMDGHAQGRNTIALRSPAVAQSVTIGIAELSASDVVATAGGMAARCAGIAAALEVQVFFHQGNMRFELEVTSGKLVAPAVGEPG